MLLYVWEYMDREWAITVLAATCDQMFEAKASYYPDKWRIVLYLWRKTESVRHQVEEALADAHLPEDLPLETLWYLQAMAEARNERAAALAGVFTEQESWPGKGIVHLREACGMPWLASPLSLLSGSPWPPTFPPFDITTH